MPWSDKPGVATGPGRRGEASAGSMVVQVLKVRGVSYEQRYNRCGKPNCNICNGTKLGKGGRFGHGPYWYIILPDGKKVRRLYIGADLDTNRFRLENGKIDWAAVKAQKTERRERMAAVKERKNRESKP